MRIAMLALALVACAPKKAAEPPKTLPALTFTDASGASRSLAELRGSVVLLDFWATWCGPCKESLPTYEAWQKELGPRGFQLVAVSVDEPGAPVKEFHEKLAPSAILFLDPKGKNAAALSLPKMPTAFLLAKDGSVALRHEGFKASDAPALKARIEALLR